MGTLRAMSVHARLVVEVRCTAADSELVADRLLMLGASAVAESSPSPGMALGTAEIVLTADLEPGEVEHFSWPGTEVRIVDPGTGWLDTWRDHAVVQHAGRFVVRLPSVPARDEKELAEREGADDSIEVVVDPGHTFGSGTHETTRLCLELIGRWVRPHDTLLDVGCGSGILAVAALLAGASQATGVDIDPGSMSVSRAVASANGVADRYRFAGESMPSGQFDLVVVNMLVNEIEGLGTSIVRSVRPGGLVVASGFLQAQVPRVTDALGPVTVPALLETVASGQWRGIALRMDQ